MVNILLIFTGDTAMAGTTEALTVNEEFADLIGREFGALALAGADETVPFGAFTEGPVAPDHLKGAMATATGYTGPNAEESA
jgi:hypothetical protein